MYDFLLLQLGYIVYVKEDYIDTSQTIFLLLSFWTKEEKNIKHISSLSWRCVHIYEFYNIYYRTEVFVLLVKCIGL